MLIPVRIAKRCQFRQNHLSIRYWPYSGSCFITIARTGWPIWACRASSVWMLVTIFLKRVIAGFMRQRSEADELKIGEARFQHNIGGDVELDGVLSYGQFIKKMPRS